MSRLLPPPIIWEDSRGTVCPEDSGFTGWQFEGVCDIVVTPNGMLSELHFCMKRKRDIKGNVNNK